MIDCRELAAGAARQAFHRNWVVLELRVQDSSEALLPVFRGSHGGGPWSNFDFRVCLTQQGWGALNRQVGPGRESPVHILQQGNVEPRLKEGGWVTRAKPDTIFSVMPNLLLCDSLFTLGWAVCSGGNVVSCNGRATFLAAYQGPSCCPRFD